MELKHLIVLLCICTVGSYPSKPLNDRPSELAWQAWLLVDSQNHPSETDRRITPKSVFIAPKLGQNNGSLPDCADGYRSDPMGRCIKFVKVDEAAHLDFLLERLNAMYATKSSDEGADDEVKPTSGPLQVNIPFGSGFQSAEEPEPDPEIAIIVAPTNGNFDVEDTETKFNVKRTHNNSDKTDDKIEQQHDTTMPTIEETTTESVTETTTTTTNFETTTVGGNDDLQALFFLVPMNESAHVHSNRTPVAAAADDDTVTVLSDTPVPTEPDTTNSTPLDINTEPSAFQVKAKPDPHTELASDDAVASFVAPIRVEEEYQAPSYVRFPTHTSVRFPSDFPKDSSQQSSNFPKDPSQQNTNFPKDPAQQSSNIPQESAQQTNVKSQEPHRLTSGEIQELFRQYIQQNPEVVALTSSEKHPIRRRPVSEATYTEDVQRPQYYLPSSFNHRNRDRNSEFWRPSSTWTEDNAQKPLVLRFGRYPIGPSSTRFSSERPADVHRYYEERQQQQQQQQQLQQEFSNVYGRTRRRGYLR